MERWQVLRAAADLNGETLTGFVLFVATERTEQVLERAQRIDVSDEAFKRFVEAFDAPVEEMPTLRRYAMSSPILAASIKPEPPVRSTSCRQANNEPGSSPAWRRSWSI